MQCLRRSSRAFAALAVSLLVSHDALANGAFPAAGQILVDPTDEARIWVSTTYGFAKSVDGGATFQLVCEDAIGYAGGFHPHAALTLSGAIFMGLSDGLAVGRGDTCAFERAPELEGSYVIDVSVDPSSGRAVVLVQPPNGVEPYVAASVDDLVSFSKLGVDLPQKFTALTLDAAPSDADVLYVSGILDGNPPRGALATSTDGGATWVTSLVPESDPQTAPFIAAIDPNDAGKVYVRLNSAPGKLWVSEDFGATLEKVLQTTGFLHAFRLAPDGLGAFYGGSIDGLHWLDTTTLETQELAPIAARCVTIRPDRVLACGEDAKDGFAAGSSRDGGVTFTPLLVQSCIEGIAPCASGSPVNMLCEPAWPMIAEVLGVVDCTPTAGGAGGTGQGGAPGDGAATGNGAAPGQSGGGGQVGGGGSSGEGDGCSCRESPEGAAASGLSWLALLAVARRRRRAFNAAP